MGNIVLLDEHTINKIAAGEVVDRPSSIVKELIENSIDAKATNILIEIKNGGISYIKIQDNGIGIVSDDVEMAFERHATSKIRKEEDLHKIRTMGFRGEALASVASISKVSLVTKNINDKIGTKINVEAGKTILLEEAATQQGTMIQIRDVFYNVPARYKFLKKDFTEAGYIEDVVIRQAIANPNIAFKLISNGKILLQTPGNSNLKTVVYSIFGKEIYENIQPIEYEINNIKVTGVAGLSKISRSSRVNQYTYINNRYIKDKTITTAIDKSYKEELEINKFAFCIINIDINTELIDVNVHPAKLEVKFENENQVFEVVYGAIKAALEEHNRKSSPFTNKRLYSGYSSNAEPKINIYEAMKKVNNDILKQDSFFEDFIEKEKVETVEDKKQNYEIDNEYINVDKIDLSKVEVKIDKESEDIVENEDKTKVEVEVVKRVNNPPYKYVGSVFNTYIIIEQNDKMYIIDQHAAHERLLYESIKEKYYANDRQTQMLFIPILVELKNKEKDIVNENIELFDKTGFIIEDFGDNAVKISGVPNIGYEIDYKSMFIDTLDELMGTNKTEKSEKEFRFLATVACKAAIKANMRQTAEEHISLLNDMMKLDRPFTCPHGRPTAYEISKYDIEHKFLRK